MQAMFSIDTDTELLVSLGMRDGELSLDQAAFDDAIAQALQIPRVRQVVYTLLKAQEPVREAQYVG